MVTVGVTVGVSGVNVRVGVSVGVRVTRAVWIEAAVIVSAMKVWIASVSGVGAASTGRLQDRPTTDRIIKGKMKRDECVMIPPSCGWTKKIPVPETLSQSRAAAKVLNQLCAQAPLR
jgi:hypothetical protein